jgi:phosphate transport system protein
MSEHILRRFDEELTKLRFRLVKMGGIVQEQVEFAVKAFVTNNVEMAKIIIEREDKVDKMDIKIDKQCLRIFALHQPVAMDLRLVMSAISINDNMEQIGDLAFNIAKDVIDLQNLPAMVNDTGLPRLGNIAETMISKVLDSFIYNNVELAREVLLMNPEAHRLTVNNLRQITGIMIKNQNLVESCSYLIDINRILRFITRQAVSIAEEIVFLYNAEIVKHRFTDNEGGEAPKE